MGALFAAPGCDKGEPGDSSGDSSSSESSTGDTTTTTTGDGDGDTGFWAVGGDGIMLQVAHGAVGGGYDLPIATQPDLLDIDCRGDSEAWAVGQDGLLLWTDDVGQSWTLVDTEVSAELRAISVSENTLAYAAGAGVALRSADNGRSFSALDLPALDWRGVSTSATGSVAFFASSEGELWRLDSLGELVYSSSAGFYSVDVDPTGANVVAVGQGGQAVWSHDRGETFAPVNLGVSGDLYDVVITDAEHVFAVGADGVFISRDASGASVEQPGSDDLSINSLHVSAGGRVQMVGDAGRIFHRTEAAGPWLEIPSGVTSPLFGVDEIGGHAH